MMSSLSNAVVLKFLRNNPVMNIAVSSDSKPIASVVAFAIDDDFTMHFVAHESSYKSKAIRKNPHISFSVWKHFELLVQADGIAEMLGEEKKLSVYDRMAEISTQIEKFWPPIFAVGTDTYAAFKVTPMWMRALDLSNLGISNTSSPFFEINLDERQK